MLRIAPILFAIAGSSALAACGDDPVKPGELVVKWNTGPTGATCGTFQVTNLEARVMKGDEEIASGSSQCPTDATSGGITISDLKPGSYKVELEGYNATGRGTYFGEIAKQNVSEGKTVETSTVVLALKPGTIAVDWSLPNGDRCAEVGIADIEFSLYYNASVAPTLIGEPKKVSCEAAAFEFTNLVPNGDVKIIASGLNSAKKKIATGSTEFFPLIAGDELDKDIPLTLCPGEPPVCP